MVNASVVPYLFAIALYVPSGAFLAVGHFYIGDMKSGLREIVVLTLFTGIIQVMTILFLLLLNESFDAMTVVPLAYTWLVLGIRAIIGLPSFKPLADILITLVVAYVLCIRGLLLLGCSSLLSARHNGVILCDSGSLADPQHLWKDRAKTGRISFNSRRCIDSFHQGDGLLVWNTFTLRWLI